MNDTSKPKIKGADDKLSIDLKKVGEQVNTPPSTKKTGDQASPKNKPET